MTSKPKKLPSLSEMEWEIIKPFWEKGPMAARDVFQAVPKDRNWAYRTVKTVLGRLVKKGALTYDQIGNSYLYRPVFTREEMTQASVGSFLHRVFDGALKPFVAYFAEGISEEEFRVLKVEVDRIEKRRREERDTNHGDRR